MSAASIRTAEIPRGTDWYSAGWKPYVILVLTCFLLYARTLWYGFSPMDERWLIIAEKGHLSDLSNLAGYFKLSTLGMYYRPLLSVSLLLDWQAGHGGTFCFHLTNILLHAVCSVLVFQLFLAMNFTRVAAFFLAMIFVVHPVNVHAVAWVPGRNDTMLTLFVLLSVLFLLRFLRDKKFIALLLHFFFFACTLFTKESAIVLPVIYLLVFFIFRDEKIKAQPLILSCTWIVIDVCWFFLRKSVVSLLPPLPLEVKGKVLANFFSGMVMHSGKVLLPVQQSVMPVVDEAPLWPYLLALGLMLALFVKFGVRNKKLALLGLAWFLILIVLPAWLGATNDTHEHYEHRDYTPLFGALLFLSQLNIPVSSAWMKRFGVVIILLFAAKTFFRLPVYKDEFEYSKAGTKEAPDISLFQDFFGTALQQRNDPGMAIAYFSRAIALDSGNADYFAHRGSAYNAVGDYVHALEDDNVALRKDPSLKDAYIDRSISLFYLRKFPEAKKDLDVGKSLGGNAPEEFVRALNDSLKR